MIKKILLRTIAVFWILFLSQSWANSAELTLGIANSTCQSMKQAGKIFTEKTNINLKFLCQPSGLLAKGIIEGALDIDYFLSANKKWMDEVKNANLIDTTNIRNNWDNVLVIASLPLSTGEQKLKQMSDLTKPGVQQILLGDPKIAPYGMYAKEALLNSDLWEELQTKLKYNKKISMSVRTLKKYGLSRTGVVAFLYSTNVKGKLLTHFVVPQHLYTKISYYSAPLTSSKNKQELNQFLDFMDGFEANNIFKKSGFIVN